MIDVIIPVYDGYDETRRCIESALNNGNKTPFNLLVVDDCSPNPAIKAYLQEIAKEGKIELLVNEKNKGFVGTVNRGMSLHPDRDVVLLNSDTVVANDWLDRMAAHAAADSRIATITPFSNNAEICSFPTLCKANALLPGKTVAETDAVFAGLPADQIDVPTGVGFCMYIARSALAEVGLFDEETFGRGYGEENDFCLRAAAKGWRNIICSNVFVFHDGGVSFSTEKAARVQHAMEVLDKRYPFYHRVVHEHIQADPERPYRVMAQLRMMQASPRKKYAFVSHRLGGGVIKHLYELADYLSEQLDVVLLRPAEHSSVELCGIYGGYDWSLFFQLPAEQTELMSVLSALGIERLHLHHVMGIPDDVLSVITHLSLPYDVTLHDYYLVNANPTLIGKDGMFAEDAATRDQCCAEAYPIPDGMTAVAWREKYGAVLSSATRVFAPSERCRAVYLEYFPSVAIDVAYHPEWEQSWPYPQPTVPVLQTSEKLRVLVLGAISREKGADVLEKTATYRDPLERLEYHLLGYAYRPLAPEVIQHGPYEDAKVDALLAEYQPHVIWFPVQWHETYCYALSAALRAGVPVLSTDLGSFPERLAGRPMSFIKPWRTTPIEWNDCLLQIRDWILANQHLPAADRVWHQPTPESRAFLYARDYVLGDGVMKESALLPGLDRIRVWAYPHQAGSVPLSSREQWLRILLRVREWPGVHHVLRLVPFEWQRNIKRWFSHRAIHDIVHNQEHR